MNESQAKLEQALANYIEALEWALIYVPSGSLASEKIAGLRLSASNAVADAVLRLPDARAAEASEPNRKEES